MRKLSSFAAPNHRDAHTNARLLTWHALDGDGPAHFQGAFTHGLQAQMPWKGLRRIKASPIVTHFKEDLPLIDGQAQHYGTGARVFHDIMQSLLGDAIERFFHLQRQIWLALQVKFDI